MLAVDRLKDADSAVTVAEAVEEDDRETLGEPLNHPPAMATTGKRSLPSLVSLRAR